MNTQVIQNLQNIPLALLRPSPRNVRKTGGTSTGDLVASIRAQGLLQPLVVRPAGEHFEVDAGGRRLRALKQIAAEDNLDDTDFKIPCNVLEASESTEASLAENTIREAMHPADQADAFAKLAADGMSTADIAARFGLADRTVSQRLKLAKVAPEIVARYRAGELDLEQVEAFAISDDQAAQLKYFTSALKQKRKDESLRDAWQLSERQIREALTKGEIGPDDPRVKVVDVATYVERGGAVRRDLFGSERDVYVTDAKLLNDLAQEAVDRKASEIKEAEGWAWCEGRVKWDHDAREKSGYKQLTDGWLAKSKFTAEERANAGVIVSCSHGGFEIHRGWLNAEGAKALRKADAGTKGKKATKAKAEKKGLSDSLTLRLTTDRTAALQATLIAAPGVALIALAHALALQLLYAEKHELPTVVGVKAIASLGDIDDSTVAGAEIVREHRSLQALLPKNREELFAFLAQNTDAIPRVLAYATAVAVDWRKHNSYSGEMPAALELARAAGLDMLRFWQPTVDSYLGSVTREQIEQAVKEAGADVAQVKAMGSRKDAAARAAELLAGRGWLPELLMIPAADASTKPARKRARS